MTICLLNSHPYPYPHPRPHPYPWCYPYPRFSNADGQNAQQDSYVPVRNRPTDCLLNQLLSVNHLVNDRHPIKRRRFLAGFLLCILTVQKLWDFNFLRGLRTFWMDFRSEGTRRSVNLSTFLLRSLKVSDAIFRGKIAPALEPFKTTIPLLSFYYLIETPKRLTQNPSKSLKRALLRQKDDYIAQVRKFNVYLILIYRHTQRYIAIGEANDKSGTLTIK